MLLQEFPRQFANEAACQAYLDACRWPSRSDSSGTLEAFAETDRGGLSTEALPNHRENLCSASPRWRMRSETEVPIYACLSTATICSTPNHVRFTATAFPFSETSMLDMLRQFGPQIRGPTSVASQSMACATGQLRDLPSRARSKLNAALINAKCVKACGKLPSDSPLPPICSAYSPR